MFNTDQGAQYTSIEFTKILLEAEIKISMDGRGRALDNVWIERLWRTVKQEEVYIRDYVDGLDAHRSLEKYFVFITRRDFIHRLVIYHQECFTGSEIYLRVYSTTAENRNSQEGKNKTGLFCESLSGGQLPPSSPRFRPRRQADRLAP